MPSAPTIAADELGDDVADGGGPVSASSQRERDGDGGVDVTSRDFADSEDHRGDDEAEGQGNDTQIGFRELGA